MKSIIISTIALVLALTSCQQKQYAYVQQGKVENFESSRKVTQSQVANQTKNEITSTITNNINETNQLAASEVLVLNEETASLNNNISENEVLVYNQESINSNFEKLNKVEAFVEQNTEASFETIKNTDLLKDIELDTNTSANVTKDNDLPLNIPAFLWGCFLGGLGILLVYIFTEDKEQTKKALYGCLTTGGVVAVIYIVLIAIGLSAGTL
ncbi:hypothetical protein GCM10011514_32870 [Emticicia aquatilis]|uniref:Uncharacterized protein n=1 Tax=Emticicia aquatilis TaxID=1537369 RepID=A0A917DSM0_9BACT|nr:hypothetical protein [Emticicia aquatilis]GGD66269.1 hypothetical protein GCM10011514_32870 [Emticicia aquatilis]